MDVIRSFTKNREIPEKFARSVQVTFFQKSDWNAFNEAEKGFGWVMQNGVKKSEKTKVKRPSWFKDE
jgi:hypothetical protein